MFNTKLAELLTNAEKNIKILSYHTLPIFNQINFQGAGGNGSMHNKSFEFRVTPNFFTQLLQ